MIIPYPLNLGPAIVFEQHMIRTLSTERYERKKAALRALKDRAKAKVMAARQGRPWAEVLAAQDEYKVWAERLERFTTISSMLHSGAETGWGESAPRVAGIRYRAAKRAGGRIIKPLPRRLTSASIPALSFGS
ncbi:hypothetical protein BAJUN_01430 [Bajunvirus bajun]|uniref:Uncharacterized protein n=1 Tax=Brevundimonas phage vB_BgoS-Bajun TaxID=2948594 RepID=A0A9E7N6Q9_9CAUD|nr:hypothetical protein BAJUN_01430 [Brevundimonas phage vB_BgoS-Bajun]